MNTLCGFQKALRIGNIETKQRTVFKKSGPLFCVKRSYAVKEDKKTSQPPSERIPKPKKKKKAENGIKIIHFLTCAIFQQRQVITIKTAADQRKSSIHPKKGIPSKSHLSGSVEREIPSKSLQIAGVQPAEKNPSSASRVKNRLYLYLVFSITILSSRTP